MEDKYKNEYNKMWHLAYLREQLVANNTESTKDFLMTQYFTNFGEIDVDTPLEELQNLRDTMYEISTFNFLKLVDMLVKDKRITWKLTKKWGLKCTVNLEDYQEIVDNLYGIGRQGNFVFDNQYGVVKVDYTNKLINCKIDAANVTMFDKIDYITVTQEFIEEHGLSVDLTKLREKYDIVKSKSYKVGLQIMELLKFEDGGILKGI